MFPAFRKTVQVRLDPHRLGLRDGFALQLLDELDGRVCTLEDIELSTHTPARILVPFLRQQ